MTSPPTIPLDSGWASREADEAMIDRLKQTARDARAAQDAWNDLADMAVLAKLGERAVQAARAARLAWALLAAQANWITDLDGSDRLDAWAELNARADLADRAVEAARAARDELEAARGAQNELEYITERAEWTKWAERDARVAWSLALGKSPWAENEKTLSEHEDLGLRASQVTSKASRISPSQHEDLGLRASQVTSKASRIWSRFGTILPIHAREKFYGPDLADHASDFYEALATATTRCQQNRLIVRFTAAAVGKVLACAGVAFRRRLLDELNSLMGLARRREMQSSSSTPRDLS